MSIIQIETSQNVIMECTTASALERIVAFVVDAAILGLYFYMIFEVAKVDFLGDLDNPTIKELFQNIFVFFPLFFYDLLFEVFNKGKTPGKMLLKMQVIKITGEPASFGDYCIRWIMKPIDMYGNFIFIFTVAELFPTDSKNVLYVLFGMPIGIIALLSVSISKKGQRIGDYLADTTLVKRRNAYSLKDTILQKTESTYEVKYHNALRLSDKDVRLIKETLEYYTKSKDIKYIKKLSDKAQEYLGIEYIENPIVFLHRLMKDYNHLAMEENGRN